MKEAIKAAYTSGITSKFNGKKPASWKNPLRDGDTDRTEDDAYQNSFFINASAKTRPGVVDKARQPITDQEEFVTGTSLSIFIRSMRRVMSGLRRDLTMS